MEILTVFVLLLNTRTLPVDVPTKTCLPDGSNRTVVMMELTSYISGYCKEENSLRTEHVRRRLHSNLRIALLSLCVPCGNQPRMPHPC